MSALFGGARTTTTVYAGIPISATSAALPVPIGWGQNLIGIVCIDYDNFHSGNAPGTKGGKGGFFSSLFGPTEKVYYADVILAVGEGPIASIPDVYQSSFSPISLTEAGLDLVVGNIGQAPTTYWEDTYPEWAIGYSGIGYVWGFNFNLGPSAALGNIQLVVDWPRYGTSFNGVDADPALVISDFLTSTQYGVGFTATISGLTGTSGDASLQSYCQAVGLGISPLLKDREAANSILARWLQILNCTCVWSSGILKFIPRGDTAITANGWTYTPDLTVQYALDDDSYCPAKGKDKSDPVLVTDSDPYELDNVVSLEIIGRDDQFNTSPIIVFDQAAMDRYGIRVGDSISAHEICTPTVGQLAAQLILQRGLYILRTFSFKLSWEYCLLDPMDFVSISDSRIGLSATVVRIVSIEEDADGLLDVVAEEFPLGVATANAYPIQATSNGAPDSSPVPNPVNAPILWEPQSILSNGLEQIWCAISPQSADPNWGGCDVNLSLDGTTYAYVGTFEGVSAQGVLLSNLPSYSGANPDTTDTMSVNLQESGGVLTSTTLVHAAAGINVCLVDDEYISFETATLGGSANQFACTTLFRGLFGSTIASHSVGAPVVLISSPLFKYTLPTSAVGQPLWLKFQSFNAAGQQLESLSSCTAYSYGRITGAGVAVASSYNTPFTPSWGTPSSVQPAVGNGHISGAYSNLGYSYSQYTLSIAISLTVGSTTTFGGGTGSTVWQFLSTLGTPINVTGSYTLTTSGGVLIGSGTVAQNSLIAADAVNLFDGSGLGYVNASTYTIPVGAVLTIVMTWQLN